MERIDRRTLNLVPLNSRAARARTCTVAHRIRHYITASPRRPGEFGRMAGDTGIGGAGQRSPYQRQPKR